jgi:hypothetical protein
MQSDDLLQEAKQQAACKKQSDDLHARSKAAS